METIKEKKPLEFVYKGRHQRDFKEEKQLSDKVETKSIYSILNEVPCTDKELGYHFHTPDWLEYRRKWDYNATNNIVEALPIQLDLWAVDACNLKCPMCPRTLGNASNKIMRPELIEKVFDEISKSKLYALNLGGLGEPTMLPKFTEYIKRAKDLGVVDVNAHTNGTLLKPKFNKQLIESGIDRLVISLDAVTKERFEAIRVGANYERVYGQVNELIEQRNSMGRDKPHIKLNIINMSVGDNADEEIHKFIDYWKDKVNRVAILPLFEYDEMGREVAANMLTREYREDFRCGWLWQRMSITTAGNVVLCLRDIATEEHSIGDFNKQTMSEIWNGKIMNDVRKLHMEGHYRKTPLCTYCPNAVKDSCANA